MGFIDDILVFLIVLGLLVSVHEFGHFIAAKACNVYVERFSVGMPPRIWGFQWGETDYCIGASPIGGYVKMAGQEDMPTSEERQEEHFKDVPKERWLSSRPAWQRAIVFAAGPAMNIVLAILLYAMLPIFGEYVPESRVESRIGYIEPESPAAQAPLYAVDAYSANVDREAAPDATGWQTGDLIHSVNGSNVRNIAEVAIDAVLNQDQQVRVAIERPGENGASQRYISFAQPQLLDEDERPRFGIAPYTTPLIDRVLPGTPAEEAGLEKGDIILEANGQKVDAMVFSDIVTKKTRGEPLDLRIQRGSERIHKTLVPGVIGRLEDVVIEPPLHTADPEEQQAQPIVAGAKPSGDGESKDGPIQRLLRGDVILEINGEPATVARLREISETEPAAALNLTVERPAVMGGLMRRASTLDIETQLKPAGVIGIVWGARMVERRLPITQAIPEGFTRSWQALSRTVGFIAALFQGSLGVNDFGGPVMIFRATAAAANRGMSWLVDFVAFISINLAVFNLLPLPVLDGGHLVGLGIESITRRKVHPKVALWIQQIGVIFILMFLVFIVFNDVRRWLGDIMP